ncbi:hypothetical protein BDB01DRAFT_719669 [Pilobolus umbonatus]|nr:hypothetical protein BDB01DRAFT_719669 [Pilobolus umbonatus]
MATKRTLTLSEIEILKNQDLSAYPLLDLILPNQLPDLIDLNQFMAVEILPLLLTSDHVHLIRSCDLIEDGVKGARQVKQVTRFIQSLLENKIITAHDYLFEIKSFCVHYMKIKGVTALFRWISNETSNQQQQQQQLSVAGPS